MIPMKVTPVRRQIALKIRRVQLTTPPVEPQAPAQIEEKNGCWLDDIQWDWYL